MGTEFISGISFAYEAPEFDILLRPPRRKDEAMVTFAMLSFSYLQIGVIETLGALYAYFCVFGYYGISPTALYKNATTYFKTDSPLFFTNGQVFVSSKNHKLTRKLTI